MAHNKTFAGSTYSIPDTGDRGWGSLSNFLDAVADNAATTRAQTWELTNVTSTPYTAVSTDTCINVNVAATTTINLPAGSNGRMFAIRDNSGNAVTYNITVDPAGGDTINGSSTFTINRAYQTIVIIYDSTSGDWKVLANGVPTPAIITSVSDTSKIDITLSTAGDLSADVVAGSLVNADVSASAAIARTKLASGTASHVVTNDGSGVMTSEAQLDPSRGGTGVNNSGTLTIGSNNLEFTTSGATNVTLPTTGTVATLAGTETLTNKTISGSTATSLVSGSGTLTLNTSGTVTVPNATDTLVGKATTDDLTNKSFNGTTVIKAANELRFNNSGNTYYTSLKAGANSADLSLTLPLTDGSSGNLLSTDGSGNLSFTAPTDPLATVAANDSNVVFTNADTRTQVCTPTADRTYTLPTTSISAGDTWTFVNQSSAYVITINSSGGNFVATVFPKSFTKVTSLQATPTTAAHWLFLDAQSKEFVSYTPSAGAGFGTVTGAAGTVRRIGKTLHINVTWTNGTAAASIGSVSLPFGYSLDTNGLAITGNTTASSGSIIGNYIGSNASITRSGGMVTADGTSTTLVYFGIVDAVAGNHLIPVTSVSTQCAATGNIMYATIHLPISG